MKAGALVATLTALAVLISTQGAIAECNLDQLVGYTLVAAERVSGFYDQDGKQGSDFEGCTFGRVLVFLDGKGVACREYRYSYSYMPTAYIFANGGSQGAACIGDEIYLISLALP